MPQRFETAVAHIAVYQLGAVAMPLSMLFGPDALEYRLQRQRRQLAIVDESAHRQPARGARRPARRWRTLVAVGGAEGQGDVDWRDAARRRGARRCEPVDTAADDAAS